MDGNRVKGAPPSGHTCANCGALVSPADRFCMVCGEALAGARYSPNWMVIGGGVAVVAVALAVWSLVGGSASPFPEVAVSVAVDSSMVEPTDTVAQGPTRSVLEISDIRCSSVVAAHPCSALIDRDLSSTWSGRISGAEIVAVFASPARVAEIVFTNDPSDSLLTRKARLRDVEIHLTGSDSVVTAELEPGHGPYSVSAGLTLATGVVIHVRSVHESEHPAGADPSDEVALAELRFVGVVGG